MRIRSCIPVAASSAVAFELCVLFPTTADAGDNPWRLRLFSLSMNPTGHEVIFEGSGERIAFDAGGGYRL
jgi:hypothetical protein